MATPKLHRAESWFEISKEGLGKVAARRGRAFILYELLQNAFDEDGVTSVEVTMAPLTDRRARTLLRIVDDAPTGFRDLSHAYTAFAESYKKSNAEKRGKFDIGEKFVLSLCEQATLVSTKGTILFLPDGTRQHDPRQKTERGTAFELLLKITKAEAEEAAEGFRTILPPAGVSVTLNGERLPLREPVTSIEAALPTEIADAEGHLRRTSRKTRIQVFEPLPGERPHLYEMGIPVCALESKNDRFHYDVCQRVPVGVDRDAVTPGYLRAVRTIAFNATHDLATEEDCSRGWVRDALADERIEPEAVRAAITKLYGQDAVAFDPHDQEANKLAMAEGRTVVYGRSLSGPAWENVRQKTPDLLPAAGKVTPSPKHVAEFGYGGDSSVPEEKWTRGMSEVVDYMRRVGSALIGCDLSVRVANEPDEPARSAAWFGGGELTLNLGILHRRWFECGITEAVDALLIHELGHHYCSDHLDRRYVDALCDLGARLKRLSVEQPEAVDGRSILPFAYRA